VKRGEKLERVARQERLVTGEQRAREFDATG
jgi:hypothetical protein